MEFIDKVLNRITMYRLVLYYLLFLFFVAIMLGAAGLIPYSPARLLFSAGFITIVCWVMNAGFAYVFNAPTNVESVYVTALILALIITPGASFGDVQFLFFGYIVSTIAIGSKYILAIGKKHIFNPVAMAVVITALIFNQSASWWVGATALAPFVVVGGLLIVRKIIRFDLVVSFILVAVAGIIGSHLANPAGLFSVVDKAILSSPLFFFAFVMLTEPLTTPPTAWLRICYGALVGFLFVPALHVGNIYSTPELALVVGNVFSYLVSPKKKLLLTLQAIKPIATDCYDFVFSASQKFNFKPGQYLEWTLPHTRPDTRGNRRYFTISSAPGEKQLALGVKIYPNPSSFKKTLLGMKLGDKLIASQLAGEFVLPKKPEQKLVFIAGGIGVTPFHSMIMDLLNRLERRPIVMFYSDKTKDNFVYTSDFDAAERELGIKTVYTLTDTQTIPLTWKGERGYITREMILKYVPDYFERIFYISGPHSMVVAFDKILRDLGVNRNRIKKDFFPGLV